MLFNNAAFVRVRMERFGVSAIQNVTHLSRQFCSLVVTVSSRALTSGAYSLGIKSALFNIPEHQSSPQTYQNKKQLSAVVP